MSRLGGIPDLIFKNIQDRWVQQNFFRIQKFLLDWPLFRGNWKFFEISVESAVTSKPIPHGLDFKPLDVIETSKTGPGVLTWEYESFDKTNLVVTTTGACTVRAFVGAYRENSGGQA